MTRLTAVVVVLLLLLWANPAGAATPIQPDNRPTPLAGEENGYVSPQRLITVIPGCRVSREAAPSLALLYRTASGAGVRIGASDCYRPVSGQVNAQRNATAKGNSACAAVPTTYPDGRPKGTSMHGWGKAVDFSDNGRGMAFGSPGYRFLKAEAGRLGWNHPGWAEPGGSSCPEAWHWEWVGDGGTKGADQIKADVVDLLPGSDDRSYATVTGLGAIAPKGAFKDQGSAASTPLNWVIVGAAPTTTGNGYWMLGADGGIFTFGDAGFFGSTGDKQLNQPVVTMAATPTGRGYWLAAGDGGMFTFGDAGFFGSTGDRRLNSPVVGMTPTADGRGYWLVAADGGIFTFGTAAFHGSTGDRKLNSPIVGIAATADGGGYWLVAADGGIFTFGNAAFHGSGADRGLQSPVVAMTRTSSGYSITAADGTVLGFS
jgi:hypothetical protein